MLSKSCIYAIKIEIYLALQKDKSNNYTGVTEISKAIGSPKAFTAKILQQLTKADLLESVRGPNGGFCLPKDKKVSLADIVRAIDGNQLLEGCILGFKECSAIRPCPAHFKFKKFRDDLNKAFTTTDVEDMRRIVESEKGFLIRE